MLADALQDVGCDNDGILSHCRTERTHVRGWPAGTAIARETPPPRERYEPRSRSPARSRSRGRSTSRPGTRKAHGTAADTVIRDVTAG